MIKNRRRRVVRWDTYHHTPESRCATPHAILECGHVANIGLSDLRPKWMACWECGPAKPIFSVVSPSNEAEE